MVPNCCLLGVSTQRLAKLVEMLGITSLSKSQVLVIAKELDTAVEAFRTRPLDVENTFIVELLRPPVEPGQFTAVGPELLEPLRAVFVGRGGAGPGRKNQALGALAERPCPVSCICAVPAVS